MLFRSMMCPNTFKKIKRMSRIPYALTIGSFMYVMLCTRPDITLAMSVTSKYQSNLGEEHWIAMKNILKYLRRTKDLFLIFGGDSKLRVRGILTQTSCLILMIESLHQDMYSFAMVV